MTGSGRSGRMTLAMACRAQSVQACAIDPLGAGGTDRCGPAER